MKSKKHLLKIWTFHLLEYKSCHLLLHLAAQDVTKA